MCLCFDSSPPERKDGAKGKSAMYDKYYDYQNTWDITMCQAPCAEPCCCLIGCLPCAWCCTQYTMRKRVLNAQSPGSGLDNYECGQGYLPKCCCGCWNPGHMGEKSCPSCCLCCEACCCPGLVITGSRLLMMDLHQITPDPCDNRIIRLNNCLQILACVCQILAIFISELRECADCISCIADIVFLMSAGCMVAQLNRELHKRHPPGSLEATGGAAPAAELMDRAQEGDGVLAIEDDAAATDK